MRSFPWDSVMQGLRDDGYPIYDRTYSAEDWQKIYKTFFSNGVFMFGPDTFHVTAGNGMTVLVTPGFCHTEGVIGWEESNRTIAIQASDATDRIDTVVLRCDFNLEARKTDIFVKRGTASASPVRPELTRTETVWELGIADVLVSAGQVQVIDAKITDTRLETARCGVVTPFDTIDTTTFYAQIQDALDRMTTQLQAETDRAVNLAQDVLSSAVITNERIDELWGGSVDSGTQPPPLSQDRIDAEDIDTLFPTS